MQCSILDRLLLLNLLKDVVGDIYMLRIVRTLKEDLSFSEADFAAFKIVQTQQQITWDDAAETMKDIEIGEKAASIIRSKLQQLSDANALPENHLRLAEVFLSDVPVVVNGHFGKSPKVTV